MAATTPHCQAEYVIGENTKRKDEAPPSGSSLHLMPCKIHCTCDKEENTSCRHPASVDTFFDPVMRKTPAKDGMGEEYSATFRGRPLRGVLLDVAEGYAGQVLRKSDGHGDLESGMEGEMIECKRSFDRFYYWNLQTPPTADDRILQALQYTKLAKSLHGPVTPDNLTEE